VVVVQFINYLSKKHPDL